MSEAEHIFYIELANDPSVKAVLEYHEDTLEGVPHVNGIYRVTKQISHGAEVHNVEFIQIAEEGGEVVFKASWQRVALTVIFTANGAPLDGAHVRWQESDQNYAVKPGWDMQESTTSAGKATLNVIKGFYGVLTVRREGYNEQVLHVEPSNVDYALPPVELVPITNEVTLTFTEADGYSFPDDLIVEFGEQRVRVVNGQVRLTLPQNLLQGKLRVYPDIFESTHYDFSKSQNLQLKRKHETRPIVVKCAEFDAYVQPTFNMVVNGERKPLRYDAENRLHIPYGWQGAVEVLAAGCASVVVEESELQDIFSLRLDVEHPLDRYVAGSISTWEQRKRQNRLPDLTSLGLDALRAYLHEQCKRTYSQLLHVSLSDDNCAFALSEFAQPIAILWSQCKLVAAHIAFSFVHAWVSEHVWRPGDPYDAATDGPAFMDAYRNGTIDISSVWHGSSRWSSVVKTPNFRQDCEDAGLTDAALQYLLWRLRQSRVIYSNERMQFVQSYLDGQLPYLVANYQKDAAAASSSSIENILQMPAQEYIQATTLDVPPPKQGVLSAVRRVFDSQIASDRHRIQVACGLYSSAVTTLRAHENYARDLLAYATTNKALRQSEKATAETDRPKAPPPPDKHLPQAGLLIAEAIYALSRLQRNAIEKDPQVGGWISVLAKAILATLHKLDDAVTWIDAQANALALIETADQVPFPLRNDPAVRRTAVTLHNALSEAKSIVDSNRKPRIAPVVSELRLRGTVWNDSALKDLANYLEP